MILVTRSSKEVSIYLAMEFFMLSPSSLEEEATCVQVYNKSFLLSVGSIDLSQVAICGYDMNGMSMC